MQQRTAHVSVVGDNELSREGLKRVLSEARFSAQCLALADLVDHLDELEDDASHIILIEADDAESAAAASRLIRSQLKNARLVILGADHDLVSVREALAIGVDGCLARQTSCLPLMLMLELVALGECVLPRKVVDQIASDLPAAPSRRRECEALPHDLSSRELGILRCLAEGDPNKIIGRKLGIAEATVKIHVKGILRKLQVLNRTQAAVWVIDRGLFDRSEYVNPAFSPPAATGQMIAAH